MGTPYYMAPEVIRGKARGYEAAADWWSYGAITYELLTGFTPFQVMHGSRFDLPKWSLALLSMLSLSPSIPPLARTST